MKMDIELLNSIRKATQMGVYGIEAVMDETGNPELYRELHGQLEEYERISEEADRLLAEHGGQPKNIGPLAHYGSSLSAKMKIRMAKDKDAKVVELMMQGNTKGMIKSIHNNHTMSILDPKVSGLSNRLLQTEQSNIDSLKQYL
ncbi:MAG: hypothetical protein IKT58_00020 [Oscillospiraceae bacterium]|nr:hypothetical protein [Oscillospiraceae bacterium]